MSKPYISRGGGSYSGRGESSGGAWHSLTGNTNSDHPGLLGATGEGGATNSAGPHRQQQQYYHHSLPPIHYITEQLLVTALPEQQRRTRHPGRKRPRQQQQQQGSVLCHDAATNNGEATTTMEEEENNSSCSYEGGNAVGGEESASSANNNNIGLDLSTTDGGDDNDDDDDDDKIRVAKDTEPYDDEDDAESDDEGQRENLAALASFLMDRHSFLVFHLADERPDERFVRAIGRQVVHLPWNAVGAPMLSQIPTVGTLLHLCYALSAWLGEDDEQESNDCVENDIDCNRSGEGDSDIDSKEGESGLQQQSSSNKRRVAVISCSNGKTRSALACACYLHFARAVDNAHDGFCHFLVRTYAGVYPQNEPEDVWATLPPSLHLLLSNFEQAVELQGYMQLQPLSLKAITLQGVPVDQKPCLDLWDGQGRHLYSSQLSDSNDECLWNDCGDASLASTSSSVVAHPSSLSLSSRWVDEEGFYKVNVVVAGDFCLMCRFGGTPDCDPAHADDPSTMLFRYVNTTGFLSNSPLSLDLPKSRVDIQHRYRPEIDEHDFMLTLAWDNDAETEASPVVASSQIMEDSMDRPFLVPVLKDTEARQEGWRLIGKHHAVGAHTDGWDDLVSDFLTCDPKLSSLANVSSSPPTHIVSLALCLANCDPLEARSLLLKGRFTSWWKRECQTGRTNESASEAKQSGEISEVSSQESEGMGSGSVGGAVEGANEPLQSDSERQSDDRVLAALESVDILPFVDDADLAVTQVTLPVNKDLRQQRPTGGAQRLSHGIEPAIMNPNPGDVRSALLGIAHYNGLQDDSVSSKEGASRPRVPVLCHLDSTVSDADLQQQIRHFASSSSPLDDPENTAAVDLFLNGVGHAGVSLQDLIDLRRESRDWNLLDNKSDAVVQGETVTRTLVDAADAGDTERTDTNMADPSVSQASVDDPLETSSAETNPNEAKHPDASHEALKNPSPNKEDDDRIAEPQGGSDTSCPHKVDDDVGDDATKLPMKLDPRFAKYWKMKKVGLPDGAIRNAIRRDEKEESILDLDWEQSYEEQTRKDPGSTVAASHPPMKTDERFEKYWKMKSVGLPQGAVRNAIRRDGKDESIMDLDWERNYEEQCVPDTAVANTTGPPMKEDERFKKYWKMKGLGLPDGAIRHAMVRDGLDGSVLDLEWEKNYEKQISKDNSDGPPIKDDPRFEKYSKMIGFGLPDGAIRNAMVRDGVDTSILDMDWEKSFKSQTGKVEDGNVQVPLKDDPEFAKFFKMLNMGLPKDAVRNALLRDGKDPSIVDLDPNSYASSRQEPSTSSRTRPSIIPPKRVRRKRIFWKPIDQSQIKEDSLWSLVKGRSMNLLDYDAQEFDELFTESADPKEQKKSKATNARKLKVKKAVQVIDGKRSMNGGIILLRLRTDYKKIASLVDTMEHGSFDSTQLKALKDFLPTEEERKGLQSYMSKAEDDEAKKAAFADLSECEKYMYTMIDVPNADTKFDCMLFREQFHARFNELVSSIRVLDQACDEVKGSSSLREVLGIILIVVNRINTGGVGGEAAGFSLEALLKLNEAKAFDKKTSVLHYLVKLMKQNDESLLGFHKDLAHVAKAQSVTLDTLLSEIKDLQRELQAVYDAAKEDADQLGGERRAISLQELKEQITLVRCVADVKHYSQADHVTGRTPMERFVMQAAASTETAMHMVKDVSQKYGKLLEYFGEKHMASSEFFGTMNRFLVEFASAVSQVEKEEKRAKKSGGNASSKKFGSPAVKRKDAAVDKSPIDAPQSRAKTAAAKESSSLSAKLLVTDAESGKPPADSNDTAKKPRAWTRPPVPANQDVRGLAAAAAAAALSRRKECTETGPEEQKGPSSTQRRKSIGGFGLNPDIDSSGRSTPVPPEHGISVLSNTGGDKNARRRSPPAAADQANPSLVSSRAQMLSELKFGNR